MGSILYVTTKKGFIPISSSLKRGSFRLSLPAYLFCGSAPPGEIVKWGWYDDMFEDVKLVNWGAFEDIKKIVLIKKLPKKVCSNIINEIGHMRKIWKYFD